MRGGVPGYVWGEQCPQSSVLCGELDDAYPHSGRSRWRCRGGPPRTSTMHLRIKDVRFPGRVMSIGSGHKFRRTAVKSHAPFAIADVGDFTNCTE